MVLNALTERRHRVLMSTAKAALVYGLLLSAAACEPAQNESNATELQLSDGGIDDEYSDLSDKAALSYEAESAKNSGCSVARNHQGYSGTGFVDFGGVGTWLEWNTVPVSTSGVYALAFRYANASASSRPADVIINGVKIGNIPFASTGSWTNWKTASINVNLRAGNNIIRIYASGGEGGPNIDNMSVNSGSPSGTGTVRDLEFVNYAYLPRKTQRHTFANVTANYILYDESNGREGFNDIRKEQSGFVGMSGATLVGYGGGRDKYIALFKVTSKTVVIDIDQGQEDADGGAGHAIFIKTARTLNVVEARSMDPSLKVEDVPGPSGSGEVVFYAEDEGGKSDRDARFRSLAYRYFGSGDDLVYVFAKALGDTPNGDGAIMRLRIQ